MVRNSLKEKWNLNLSTEIGVGILPGCLRGVSPAWILCRKQGQTRQLERVPKEAASDGAAAQVPEASVANPYIH